MRRACDPFVFEAMEARRLLSGATIGMNLDGFADDSTIGAFNDLARMFRPWGKVGTPYQPDASIPLTGPADPWPDNYPLADAAAMTYATAYPDGAYQISYDGGGTVEFRDANGQLEDPHYVTTGNHKEGVIHLHHDAGGGGIFQIYLRNIDVNDPVRNLRIISPDANPAISPTFRPVFLDKLKYWNGPLRFMDWGQTNGNPLVSWADRTPTDRFSYCTGNGVPLETMIELANLTRKDVWVNLPLHADDDYVRRMAAMLRDQLNPSLKVYVENSNELWNIGFRQSVDLLFESRADPDPFIQGTDDVGRMAQLAGKKMVRVTNLFRQEYGAAQFDGRVRPTFGSFIATTYWAQKALDYIARRYGPPRDYLYGLAIAPYVGGQGDINAIDDDTLTLEKLFASMNNFIDTNITTWIQQHKALCDQFGLKLESYEAGQSLQGQNLKNIPLKEAAQDDPRMGLMYQHLINVWTANGGDIFANFSLSNHYSINGYWGLFDRIDRVTSTKFEAIKAMLPVAGPTPGARVSISSGLTGNRGDVVHAYVSIDEAAGLSSLDLRINYNTALLDLSNADVTLMGPLGANWTLTPNVDDATGRVTLVGFTTTPQTAGGGQILDLAFHVRPGAAAGTAVLDIDDAGDPSHSRLNEGQMPANFADGSITVPVGVSITGGAPTNPEGTPVDLTASLVGQNGAVAYLWHVVAGNGQAIADSTAATFAFTPADEGTYTATLNVTDQNGISGVTTKLITVTNVNPAPAIGGGPAVSSPEGTAVNLTGTFVDPGSLDTPALAWAVTRGGVAYGSGGSGASFSFTPDDEGAYVVTLTVTDKDGGVGSDTRTINVSNANPTVSVTGAPAADVAEGTAVALGTTVTDAGAADTFGYAWTVTKDGLAYGAGGTGATFAFTPDDNGVYVVTVTVTDDDGGIGTDGRQITVTNVAPTVALTGVPAASTPELTAINLGTIVTDPGSADTFTYLWTVTLNGQAVGAGAAFSFTPVEAGSYTVSLRVTDDDGAFGDAGASVAVTPVTFRVTSITPTAWGFDVAFNRGANFSPINLYTNAAGGRGLADVTLTGALQGPLNGSLVYDAGRDVYSFVKTGAPLLPDTYTVTLRSSAGGADGWVDVRGGALDGDGNGTAGDAYASAFTVGAPASDRVVGLPDFARGPGQAVNVPNAAAAGLPIHVNDTTGLTSVTLTLTFDPLLLSVGGAFGPVGWTTTMTQDAPGRVTISASGPALSGGPADVFHLSASVPAGAAYGASDVIRISQLSLNGGTVGGHADAAVHQVVYLGDASGNRDYSGMDAVDIARVAAELDEGFALFPRVDPRVIGDATGDGTLSGLDSHFVARMVVGLEQPQIPAIPAGAAAGAPGLPQSAPPLDGPTGAISLALPAGLVARPGSTIRLPVDVSALAGVVSLDLTVAYDTALLDLSNADVTLGQSAAGWTLVRNANDALGKLRLTLYRLEPDGGGAGTLLDLAFHVPLSAGSGSAAVSAGGRADEGAAAVGGAAAQLAIDATPPAVIEAAFDPNGGAHRVTVRFGENVGASLGADDFTLTNVTTGGTIDRAKFAVSYDPRSNSAALTFPGLIGGILPDGDYRLTVGAAGVTDAAGNPLDGTGAGAGGGDFAMAFYQLLGDLNRDHVVDQADRAILTGALGGPVVTAADGDANGDHLVNFADLVAVAQHYDGLASGAAAGDLNGDGTVNFADLVAVAQNYDRDGRGDLNGDGLIDGADLARLDGLLNPPAVAAAAPVAAAGEVAAAMAVEAPVVVAEKKSPTVAARKAVAVIAPKGAVTKVAPPAKLVARPKGVKAAPRGGAGRVVVTSPVAAANPFGKSKRIRREWVELLG